MGRAPRADTGHASVEQPLRLNLQHSGHIVVWLSLTWSLEDYTQANARVDRQGQERPVQIHRIIEPDTVDVRKLSVLAGRAELAGAVMEELRRD